MKIQKKMPGGDLPCLVLSLINTVGALVSQLQPQKRELSVWAFVLIRLCGRELGFNHNNRVRGAASLPICGMTTAFDANVTLICNKLACFTLVHVMFHTPR